MKRIIILLSMALLFSTLAYAQDSGEDNTARDMAILRKKLGQMKREMDLLMKDIITTTPVAGEPAIGAFGADVYVDVLQNDKNVIVKADLPGMDKDKINVTLDNDKFLKITGTREIMKSQKSPGVVRQERFSGNFSKIIELPCEVMTTGISATYKEGVLEITIPKKVQTAKQEEVKISIK